MCSPCKGRWLWVAVGTLRRYVDRGERWLVAGGERVCVCVLGAGGERECVCVCWGQELSRYLGIQG